MCTMITTQAKVEGSGKGASGWFELKEANVSYDHPYHIRMEHALNIDFVNEAAGPWGACGRRAFAGVGTRAGEGDHRGLRSG